MNPPRRPLRSPSGGEPPFPSAGIAFLLTLGAILAGGFVAMLFFELGPLAAEGIGTAIGIGGVATLAARRVAEPQAARVGLVALEWRAWPLILCLVPAVLIASELDNFAYDWSPAEKAEAPAAADTPAAESGDDAAPTAAPAAEAPAATQESVETASGAGGDAALETPGANAEAGTKSVEEPIDKARPADAAELPEPLIDPDDPFSLMEGLIVSVGIAPVIHEFLFRGVLQQGLVAQLGMARGVTLTALLWTMLRPVPSASPARFVAAFVAWFAMGWLLGMVRIATGSILGSILLASLWAAVGYASLALVGKVAVPGMNVDGTHLPAVVTIASILIVTLAGRRLVEQANARSGTGPQPNRLVG